jgi:hypothetical protein
MKILLVFDDKFPIDQDNFIALLKKKTKSLSFEVFDGKFILESGLISKPETFNHAHKQIKEIENKFDKIFCFTSKQYDDNFFFHEHQDLSIFSFYAWDYLTDLPKSNGALYFITNFLSLILEKSDYRHLETTGCIYDFLGDKRGIDDGMRQARFCSNCLKRLSNSLTSEADFNFFEDLKVLMNCLSEASRWNIDVLSTPKNVTNTINKRKPKGGNVIKVVIASPGDTEAERKTLLDSLEVKFRRDNHENYCGFRIIVSGWEDLASQPGYAQDVINEKIICDCDFVVAVFKHKLGTPTKNLATGVKRAESGTAEELLQALDKTNNSHPIGMAYFYSKAPVISLDSPDKDVIERDWKRLSEFKETIKDKLIYKPFTESNELLSVVLKDLEINIVDYISK